jgi:hypothetical protein
MMLTIRNGQKVWPYCPECGCRLAVTEFIHQEGIAQVTHFGWQVDRDPRGCLCSKVNESYYVLIDSVRSYLSGPINIFDTR